MIPAFPDVRPVEVGDAPLLRDALGRSPRTACEFSFANFIIWRDFDHPAITALNGNICIRIDPPDEPPFFLEPLGERDLPQTVEALMRAAGRISRASPAFASRLCAGEYHLRPLPDHFDYLYRTRELAELKGRRYDGKRNHIKQLMRRHPAYHSRALERGDVAEVLDLFGEWSRHRRADNRPGAKLPELAYRCQRRAVERAFEHYEELGLMGEALVVEGRLVGFLLGSAERDEMAYIHLSYTRPGVPGAFQTLLWEACRKTFSRYEHLNLEQDLGMTGLRKTKQSYYPLRLEEKLEIRRQEKEGESMR